MSIDLGAIPTEPVTAAFERLSTAFKPGYRYATTHEQMATIEGFMDGPSEYPHVFRDGVIWWPNTFLARLAYLDANPSAVIGDNNHVTTTVFDGFTFFRFERGFL